MDETAGKIKGTITGLFDRGAHISIASSTQFIAKKFGLNERWINYTHIELRNKLNETAYKKVPFNERILLLPHCMRNQEKCKANYTKTGLQCKKCGSCKLAKLIQMAEERNYKGIYVLPGGSMIKPLLEKEKPKAILGVACFNEAQMAFDFLKGKKAGVQAVLLTKAGCVNTDVNIEEVREKMDLIDEKAKGKRE